MISYCIQYYDVRQRHITTYDHMTRQYPSWLLTCRVDTQIRCTYQSKIDVTSKHRVLFVTFFPWTCCCERLLFHSRVILKRKRVGPLPPTSLVVGDLDIFSFSILFPRRSHPVSRTPSLPPCGFPRPQKFKPRTSLFGFAVS